MAITALKTPVKTRIGICAAAIVALLALFTVMGATPAYADYSAGKSELTTMRDPLDAGDSFKKGGCTYEVLKTKPLSDNHQGTVELVKYASKKKAANINTVRYKGNTYEVRIIGDEAFKNKRGQKVKSVKIGFNVDKIMEDAFRGCKRLTMLNMASSDVVKIAHDRYGYYVDGVKIEKNAFKGAGTRNLVVKCGKSNSSYQAAFKRALKRKGLRSDATVIA